MTPDEATKVAHTIAQADDGCTQCVTALRRRMERDFPEFDWELLMADAPSPFGPA